jgi:hypothetical protein
MSDCIQGEGSGNGKGYLIRRDPERGRNEYVHRTAYRQHKGPIPEGAVVRHTCDNRQCVNPDHLLIGSYKDNTGDMYSRGREGCSKITQAIANEIRASLLTSKELMAEYSLSRSQIHKIRSNTAWPE